MGSPAFHFNIESAGAGSGLALLILDADALDGDHAAAGLLLNLVGDVVVELQYRTGGEAHFKVEGVSLLATRFALAVVLVRERGHSE